MSISREALEACEGRDGRPSPQTSFSGLLHGEEQPGHQTADTTHT